MHQSVVRPMGTLRGDYLSRLMIGSMVITAVLCFLLSLLTETCDGISIDTEEALRQLEVVLPNQIHEERVGTLSSFELEGETHFAWLAKNTRFYPYPGSGPNGNLVYVSKEDVGTDQWDTSLM